jgi:hypothetical protein
VGQHLVGVLRRQLTGLLELGLELRGGVGQELSDLGGGLVAAGGAEHGDQDRQPEGAGRIDRLSTTRRR